MNRKGFTLIELIATIVLLSLVVGISSYAITMIIKNSKEKNYNILIENIKNASETYYQECKYANNSGITCSSNGIVSLGDLVKYGYLKGNDTSNNDKYTIVNPRNKKNISSCQIKVSYVNGAIKVISVSVNTSCPSEFGESSLQPGPGISSYFGSSSRIPWASSEDVITPVDPTDPVTPGDPVTPITPVIPKGEVS